VSNRKLRFDGWVLDPESGDLEHAGTRIRLQEQPVQVLQELIAHAGSVVTREQLIALLWPKGVVDFDTGLNTVIRKLRSALGDTSETPRYIETLPRRGYRFIADPSHYGAGAVGWYPGLVWTDAWWLDVGRHGHDGGPERTNWVVPNVCHRGPEARIEAIGSSGLGA
jgi:DNA-binding winged helix-turn-helix (wHTH) protein